MPLTSDCHREIVSELASKPGHEPVRFNIATLLIDGLSARSTDVHIEQPIPEVRGRIDALFGRTIFEFNGDLRREKRAAEKQLTRYFAARLNRIARQCGV